MTGGDQLHAEQRARVLIDRQLSASGWFVCDVAELDLIHRPASAVREVRMKRGHGQVDYLLYVDRTIVGVIEAKPEGTSLSGVEWQSAMYADGLSAQQQLQAVAVAGRLPFVFEASGSETHFTNGYDPDPRARTVYAFARPESLARILREAVSDPSAPTWRAKVQHLPPIVEAGLRPAQIDAIFDRPGYAEFRIGDYQHELGLIDSSYAPHDATGDASGVIAYWHVDDVTAALGRLIELGATEHEGIRERGSGFITASVVDPFGNILGVMQNPHYLEVLAAR